MVGRYIVRSAFALTVLDALVEQGASIECFDVEPLEDDDAGDSSVLTLWRERLLH